MDGQCERLAELWNSTNPYYSVEQILDILGRKDKRSLVRLARRLGLPPKTEAAIHQRTASDYETAVVAGDFHVPHHDKMAVKLFLDVTKTINPAKIILNGDILDCFMLSRFTKHPSHGTSLVKEIEITRTLLSDIRKAAPESEIIYIFGNHSWRFEKILLDKLIDLHGLDGINLETLLHFDKYGVKAINYHGKEQYYQYGKLFIGHFDRVSKHAGYTAKNLLDDKGVSILQGHTHRIGHCSKRAFQGAMGAWEIGCMCRLDPNYVKLPNWQQGFAVVHKAINGDHFAVEQVHILQHDNKYKCFYGGKRYEV